MTRFLGLLLAAALLLTACTPLMVQQAGKPPLGFAGPHIETDAVVSFDGARLGLSEWDATTGEPWAVIVGVHGMNDYANAFHMAAPWCIMLRRTKNRIAVTTQSTITVP